VHVDADTVAEHSTRVRTCLALLGQLSTEEERGTGVDQEWRGGQRDHGGLDRRRRRRGWWSG
jgi:hypothetical protein